MGTILNLSDLNILSDLKQPHQKLVLVGGCFDILHSGHIYFLRQAKKLGSTLVLLLVGDEYVHKLKGENRPVNTQKVRASILSSLSIIDYIVLLENTNPDYNWQHLVKIIQPDIIALTDQDQIFAWEKNYKISIINKVSEISTSKIIESNKK